METKALVITFVISIICAVLANLGTPYIKQFFIFSLSGLRRARIKEYREELAQIEIYVQNPNNLLLYLFHEIFIVLCFISLGLALYFISHTYGKASLSLSLYALSYAFGRATGKLRVINAVRQYETYRQKKSATIQHLEAKIIEKEKKG